MNTNVLSKTQAGHLLTLLSVLLYFSYVFDLLFIRDGAPRFSVQPLFLAGLVVSTLAAVVTLVPYRQWGEAALNVIAVAFYIVFYLGPVVGPYYVNL